MALFRRLRQVQQEKKAEKRLSRAELRLQKDVEEMTYNRAKVDNVNLRVEFQTESKLEFTCKVLPSKGPYQGGTFLFDFEIPKEYPFGPPSVVCRTRIFHPNICLETGQISLTILHRAWKPVFTINKIILEIQRLFLTPKLDTPLNLECAQMITSGELSKFKQTVTETMKGGFFFGYQWEPNGPQQHGGRLNGRNNGGSLKRRNQISDHASHCTNNAKQKRSRSRCTDSTYATAPAPVDHDTANRHTAWKHPRKQRQGVLWASGSEEPSMSSFHSHGHGGGGSLGQKRSASSSIEPDVFSMLSLSRADRKMASGDFEEKVKPKKKKTKPNNSSHNSTLGILGLRDGIGTSVVSSHTASSMTSMMPSSLASSMTMMEEPDEMVDETAASGVGSGVGSGSNMRPKRSATELPMTPNTFAETTSSITPMRTLGM